MEEILYNGKIYKRYSKKWIDSHGIIVCETLQKELNNTYIKNINLSEMTVVDIIAEGDKFKESGSLTLAIKYYEEALPRSDEKTISHILPRLSSCYRKCHMPHKAIEIFSYAKNKYSSDLITPVLLTTAAAAYCDMHEYENALKCCKRAYAQNNGKNDENLKNVFRRIKKETEIE